jgi:formiminoglutamase
MIKSNDSGKKVPENKTGLATLWGDHICRIDPDRDLTTPLNGSAVLVGFACDEGVRRNNGRPGAKSGPDEIRNALTRLAWHHSGEFPDAGDITCTGGDLETAQTGFAHRISKVLNAGGFPIGIGGGHEIAFGFYSGIRDFIRDKRLGLINFDAHFDMRVPVGGLSNSGTSFYQIARHCADRQWPFYYLCIGIQALNTTRDLFQTAAQVRAHWIEASDIRMDHFRTLEYRLNQFLEKVEFVYVSICLDVFNASIAPGVSAVNPLGLFPDIVMLLLRHIFASHRVIGIDIAELNPLFDIDHRTAKLAAAIIFHALEWRSQESRPKNKEQRPKKNK